MSTSRSKLFLTISLMLIRLLPAHSLSIKENPFQYSMEYTDEESQLQYLKARYYHAKQKRFITRDNYAFLNRYAYADENPIMHNDPSGHISDFVAIASGLMTSTTVGVLASVDYRTMARADIVSLGLTAISAGTGIASAIKDDQGLGIVAIITGSLAVVTKAGYGLLLNGGCLGKVGEVDVQSRSELELEPGTNSGEPQLVYDENGFSIPQGIHRDTGTTVDHKGFNKNRIHHMTHTEFDQEHVHYNATYYDNHGYDWRGFNERRIHRLTVTEFNPDGYHYNGTLYDNDGFNHNSLDQEGFNRDGYHPRRDIWRCEEDMWDVRVWFRRNFRSNRSRP